MPAQPSPSRCGLPAFRGAAWLAAGWLLVLAGCASRPAVPHTDAAAPGRPVPMLRPVGAAVPDGQNPCRAHAPTPRELAKQHPEVDPLAVPGLYTELFYGERRDAGAGLRAGGMSLRRYERFDDSDSGLAGFVLLNDASGHALMLFKGMDRPFAERDGWGGVFTDLGGVLAAKFGTGNAQFPRADDAYTEALCDKAIKSIELVGYSMGSQLANYLAVKYGAYAVVFGDMGLDRTLFERHARGGLQAARARAREHVVSLALSGDVVVKLFGVGEEVGREVALPGVLAGVLHQPEVYAHAANAAIRDRDAAEDAAAASAMRADAGGRPAGPGLARGAGAGAALAADAREPSARH